MKSRLSPQFVESLLQLFEYDTNEILNIHYSALSALLSVFYEKELILLSSIFIRLSHFVPVFIFCCYLRSS